MKAFFIKHKRKILFWIVFLFLVFYFAPRQQAYYLDSDLKAFRKTYLTPFLLWLGALATMAAFAYVLIKARSLKQAALAFFACGFILATTLFMFRDVFLGGALALNRLANRGSVQKTYQAVFLNGASHTRANFFLYDPQTKQGSREKGLLDLLYTPDLKQGDTLTLQLTKGLFGLPFHAKPFDK